MTEYMLRRLLLAIPTILLVLFVTFVMLRLVPGDIVELIMAENPYATDEDRARIEAELGLDKPILQQFGVYLTEVLRGDFGESPWTKRPIADELKNRLPVTLEFGFMSILLGLIIALPVGVLSAVRQDTLADYAARSFAILALSVPYFFTALLLVVFPSQWFGWSPPLVYKGWSDPLDHLYFYFWPALLLGVGLAGSVMRMTRNMMLEVLRQDYIRTAWAKGLRERAVILRHALKNALIPVITIVGLQVGVAIGGTLILETIFNMPGMGRFFIGAIFQRDYPSVQATVLVLAIVVVFVNIVVDLSYAWLDPRIRYG